MTSTNSLVTTMPDKPVHPLTLYRLTLELDDEVAYKWLLRYFKDPTQYNPKWRGEMDWAVRQIIGVESRIRERLNR